MIIYNKYFDSVTENSFDDIVRYTIYIQGEYREEKIF